MATMGVDNGYRVLAVKKLNGVVKKRELSDKIEEGIYNYVCEQAGARNMPIDFENVQFRRIYVNKLQSVYVNLDGKSFVGNKDLLARVKKGQVEPTRVAWMKPQEMYPELWKELIERKEASEEFMYLKKHEVETTIFKCEKCKERRCTYYQMQKRKSDEPMTTFITCVNCGNKWQQND